MPKINERRRLEMQWYMRNPYVHLLNEARQRKMRRRLHEQLRVTEAKVVIPDVLELLLLTRKNFLRCITLCNQTKLTTWEEESGNIQAERIQKPRKSNGMRSKFVQAAEECCVVEATTPGIKVESALKCEVPITKNLLLLNNKDEFDEQASVICDVHDNLTVPLSSAPKKNTIRKCHKQTKSQEPEQNDQPKKRRGRKPGSKNKPKGDLARYVKSFAHEVEAQPGSATPAASSTSQQLVTSTTLDPVELPIYYPYFTEEVDNMPAFGSFVTYIDISNNDNNRNTIAHVTDNNNANKLPTFSSTFARVAKSLPVDLTEQSLECQSIAKLLNNVCVPNFELPVALLSEASEHKDCVAFDFSSKSSCKEITTPEQPATAMSFVEAEESGHIFIQRTLDTSCSNPQIENSTVAQDAAQNVDKNPKASKQDESVTFEIQKSKQTSLDFPYIQPKENCDTGNYWESIGSDLESAHSDLDVHKTDLTERYQNNNLDDHNLVLSTIQKEENILYSSSVLEIESQLDNALDFNFEFDASDICSPDRLDTKPVLTAEEIERKNTTNKAGAYVENRPTGQKAGQPAILRKFRIPKISASSQLKLAAANAVEMPLFSPTEDLVSAVTFTYRFERLFGITCFPFLVDRCYLLASCPFSHTLHEPEQVRRELEALPNWYLELAYRFMINHKQLFRSYFVTFCHIYADRKHGDKLLNMIYDCERYLECKQYLQSIFFSLLQCGFTKENACRQILSRIKSVPSINNVDEHHYGGGLDQVY